VDIVRIGYKSVTDFMLSITPAVVSPRVYNSVYYLKFRKYLEYYIPSKQNKMYKSFMCTQNSYQFVHSPAVTTRSDTV